MGKEFDLSVIFRVLDKASGPIQKISNRFKGMVAPINEVTKKTRELGKEVKKFGEGISKVGREMTLKFSLPFAAFSALSFKASMDLNAAMANVSTLIPENVERLNHLKETVKGVAYEIGQSSVDVAGGLYQLLSFLGDTADTEKILAINAKTAKAGLTDVATATDLTVGVMKAYNTVSAEMAQKVADLAFQSVRLGATTFPELVDGMRSVFSWGGQLNVRIEELFSAFSTLAKVTGVPAEVGTQLEAIMRALVKMTPEMKKALKKIGAPLGIKKATAKQIIEAKGLPFLFQELYKYTKGSEEKMTKLFGRAEPLLAIFSLTGKQLETYIERLKQSLKASGEANDALRKQTQGINKAGFAWQQFKIRIEELRETWGDLIGEGLEPVLKMIGKIIHWVEGWDHATKVIIFTLGLFLALLGPLIVVIGKFVIGIGLIMMYGPAFAAAFSVALPVIGALSIAFVAIGAAVYILIAHFKELKQAWGIFVDTFVTGPIDAVLEKLMKLGEWIGKGMKLLGLGGAGMPDEATLKRNREETKKRAALAESKGFWSSLFGGEPQKTQTDINIKVSSDSGSTATVEKIEKKRGDASVKLATVGYVGGMR